LFVSVVFLFKNTKLFAYMQFFSYLCTDF